MCGICGVAALDGTLDPRISAALPAMTTALAHRGPDGGGVFDDGIVGLGHRRLAIIDRAGGHQPLSNEDGTVWITFNGEVYQHKQLREELIGRGHRFRTTSDTEAILHGYEEWGPAVVDRLEGMFAFAIYDQRRRDLFIARDRLGKKPLFYAVLGGVLHFASEIKSFYHSPVWDAVIDPDTIEEYLTFGYVLAPRSIYRAVRKLEAGHWLRVVEGRLEIRQYWDVRQFDTATDERRIGPELEALVREVVTERLESEVPLGAFLSGGIDSGLVVSFMAEALGPGIETTSVGFGTGTHNELGPAGLTARHLRTNHHEEKIEPRLDDVLERIVGAFDEPFADSSAVPTFYVSQMARQYVTVALSGDGGDETFGGYDFRYLPHAAEGYVRSAIGPLAGAAGWLGRHWPRHRRLPRPLRIGTLLENIGRDAATAYYYDLCFLKPEMVGALTRRSGHEDLRSTRLYEAVTAPYRRCTSTSGMQRSMYADLKVYLANDVLVKVDRMSMQHGLEVRCPLLDRRLVEFAFRTPIRFKMPRWRSKHLLKTLAAPRLPAAVMGLPKHGFTAPAGDWLAGEYATRFKDEVLSSGSLASSLLDVGEVGRLFADHRAGRGDYGQALWSVWMLECWSRQRPARPKAVFAPGDAEDAPRNLQRASAR